MKLRIILMLILLAFVVIFSIQNYKIVEIKFLFWQIEMSRVMLIYIMLFAGIAIGWMLRTLMKLAR